MLYYRYTLKPKSSFAQYLASDTVFGQLCCMLKLLGEDLDSLLRDYDKDPFAVVSCMLLDGMGFAYPMPAEKLRGDKREKLQKMQERKKEKKKKFINIENILLNGTADREEMPLVSHTAEIVRNSISRQTGTTGDDFAPYSVFETFYDSDTFFHLYVYAKDDKKELVTQGIELMGKYGFGKDASLGKGRFVIENIEEFSITSGDNCNAVYTLGNCILEGIGCEAYYNLCTRFGKHGGDAGVQNPFKNPIIMAKQGALLFMKDVDKPYVGKAVVEGISHNKAVHQGYSLYIPLEEKHGL